MKMFFGGAEIPGHRAMLADAGVKHAAFSYIGLRRRLTRVISFRVAEKFWPHQEVFLDSGAYTINKADEDTYTQGTLREMSAEYQEFVLANIDSLCMVSEFDALPLGPDWIQQQRDEFWDKLGEKFLPIWHGNTGLDELSRLAEKYQRVGVPQIALGDRNLEPVLNSLVSDYGTKLHGVAMTKPVEMASIRWDSVASTSWLSPSQFGDTIVWTGKELKRYPKKYKDRARKQHRTLFENAGFDSAKIESDDTAEVLRMTIWSWQQLVDNINRHQGQNVVATLSNPVSEDNPETPQGEVGMDRLEMRNSTPTRVRAQHERTALPVLTQEMKHSAEEETDVSVLRVRGESMRVCDTCFLKTKCPAFEDRATCAYDIPVEIRTKDQVKAMTEALIEWQFQRVAFMKMAEDLEGGYVDPNLSREIDRAMALVAKKNEMEQEGFSLKIEARERAGAGTISRLFGRDVGEQARALEAPVQIPDAMAQLGIVDAEVVDL